MLPTPLGLQRTAVGDAPLGGKAPVAISTHTKVNQIL
jgi:hypothetical protein